MSLNYSFVSQSACSQTLVFWCHPKRCNCILYFIVQDISENNIRAECRTDPCRYSLEIPKYLGESFNKFCIPITVITSGLSFSNTPWESNVKRCQILYERYILSTISLWITSHNLIKILFLLIKKEILLLWCDLFPMDISTYILIVLFLPWRK